MKRKKTVASLFAGIGGICKGFENAGAKLVWANEIDKNACITYRENFSHSLIEDDIHNLTKQENIKKLKKVDIITSGFPCQAFSIAGYQKGFDDARGNLFFETAKIIEEIKPKAFLLENVKNLTSHDKGNTFKIIKDAVVNKLGYSFIPFVLNSKDFGNTPQTRERIYIVGFKDEANYDNFDGEMKIYSIKDDEKYRNIVSSRKTTGIKTLDFRIPKPEKLNKTINDLISAKKVDDYFYYDESSKYFQQLSAEMKSRETIYQWRRVYVRENKSNLCPTLTANMGTGGHNVPLIRDNYGIRKLTPRECSFFQGYSEEYKFPNIARSHLYKQIGNSVTVTVIEKIAKEILSVLEE